jgi:hypothetical protein
LILVERATVGGPRNRDGWKLLTVLDDPRYCQPVIAGFRPRQDGRLTLLPVVVVLFALAVPEAAYSYDPPAITIPPTVYDGTEMDVEGPEEGELRLQYATDGDFDVGVWCDTGWFSPGFALGLTWQAPATMESGYGAEECDPLALGIHDVRAKYRDGGLDESDWSSPTTFEYLGPVAVPTLDVPEFVYDGTDVSATVSDVPGDFRVQYTTEEDFSGALSCDTGWFSSDLVSTIEWEIPTRWMTRTTLIRVTTLISMPTAFV